MSYEMIIKETKKIENLLEKNYQAKGRGLHEKLSSVQESIDPFVAKKIRMVATIRNKLVHEENFELKEKAIYTFNNNCRYILEKLEPKKEESEINLEDLTLKKRETADKKKPQESDLLTDIIKNFENSSTPMKIVKGSVAAVAAIAASVIYFKNI